MSRPYKEVIFYENLTPATIGGGSLRIEDYNNRVVFGSEGENNKIYKLWGGSIQQFINDFELPQDFANFWITQTDDTTNNGLEILDFYHNSISFKINMEFWYRLDNTANNENWAPCSNLTFDITCPNFLAYRNAKVGIDYTRFKPYNPNLFPIILSNSSFAGSNKDVNNYDGSTWGGLGNGVNFLVFRYGTNGDDIQICLLTKDNSVWDANGASITLTRASMKFLGFNAIKKVKRR